jgi:uncharacterized membrane protein YgcG
MSIPIRVIILFFVVVIYYSGAFAQDFTIENFGSDITVGRDSSVMVKETIVVRFKNPKHGIYREIPFRYADESGNIVRTPLEVLSVTDGSGKSRQYKVSKRGNLVNIRIGDPRTYIDGVRTYVITYNVENAILFLDDHDELYWNVTGNYWRCQVRKASANVVLAARKQSGDFWAACYTGPLNSGESACGFDTSHNSGEFFTKRNLAPREGFTIAFGWTKGLITPPPAWKKFLWEINLGENWIFVLPVLSLLLMGHLWYRRGRDPRVKESVTVMFEPPKYNGESLTPGEVGTIVDEKLDSRDITSAIVGLAVKGYIKIEESRTEGLISHSTDYYLAKVKEADEKLSPFEKILMRNIFTGELQGRLVSDLKNNFYTQIELLKTTLYGELMSKKYFLVSPEKLRKFYLATGIAVAVIGAVALHIFISSAGGKAVLAGILTGLPVLAFSKVMPAKTKAGASVYMDILGFQEFLRRAEKDRLQRMGDKDLFSKFLPYAIALDVVDNWAKAFEGVYQDPPQWYTSESGLTTFSPYNFSRSINAATSNLASAIYSAPRGSGISGGGSSGGGGFSGGGFGGGGGGSW